MQLAGQATNQRSNGDELFGEFDTYSWCVRGALSYRSAVLTLAHTSTGRNVVIQIPYSGTLGFTLSTLFDFNRLDLRIIANYNLSTLR